MLDTLDSSAKGDVQNGCTSMPEMLFNPAKGEVQNGCLACLKCRTTQQRETYKKDALQCLKCCTTQQRETYKMDAIPCYNKRVMNAAKNLQKLAQNYSHAHHHKLYRQAKPRAPRAHTHKNTRSYSLYLLDIIYLPSQNNAHKHTHTHTHTHTHLAANDVELRYGRMSPSLTTPTH